MSKCLSIEGGQGQFPLGLVPSDFALVDKYYTTTAVAEAIADLVSDGIVQTIEPNMGIGRLLRALRPPQPCCQVILSCTRRLP